MKTNEEIQREAQRLVELGRRYREEYRGTSSEIVPLPRVLVQLPDVQVTRKIDVATPNADLRIINRQRHIEAAFEDNALIFRLIERESNQPSPDGKIETGEPTEVMASRSGFDLLHAGYEMVEEDRLFELLKPYSEKIDAREGQGEADDQEVAEVENVVENRLLPPSDRLRTKAEIVDFLEGRLDAGVFIARTIDRHTARESHQQLQTRREEIRHTINQP